MTKSKLILWYISIGLFPVCLIPFIRFMFTPTTKNLYTTIICLVIVTSIYLVTTKLTTHPQYKFSAHNALKFSRECEKNGLDSIKSCRSNPGKLKEISEKSDFSKGYDNNALLELYKAGKNIDQKKGK